MIQDNISEILGKIEAVCLKIGRDSSKITLVGVTKYADAEEIDEAIKAGLGNIGENKVQEAKHKFSLLLKSGTKVTKHMIGHLQTNKVKQALEIFDCIQSIDSLKLASAVEKQAAKLNRSIDIFIQVNTAGEEQKFGVDPSSAFSLIDEIIQFKHSRLCGLMTIAPLVRDKSVIRSCFSDLRQLRDQINERYNGQSNIKMKYLSMGMTDDYELALEEGSNMVRIGRAIFKE